MRTAVREEKNIVVGALGVAQGGVLRVGRYHHSDLPAFGRQRASVWVFGWGQK